MTSITINSRTFEAPAPYAPGHVCTAVEAEILNHRFASNIRANFSRIMDGMVVTDETMPQVRKAFDEYAASYSFGGPSPIDLEARVIAEAITRQRIKAAKGKVSDYSKTAIATAADALLRPGSPLRDDIYAQAASRVKAVQQAAAKGLMDSEPAPVVIPRRKDKLDIEGLE